MTSRNVRQPDSVSEVEQWFELYVDDVQQYVARRVGAGNAPDIVADTFRLAIEHFDQFDLHQGVPRAWLFGIATNLVRRFWRTERRRVRAYAESVQRLPPTIDPLLDSDRRIDAQRRLAEIADAVSALPADDLDVLVLTAWENMSSSEVASVLNIPAGTVRSRLNRIRAQLREHQESPSPTGASDER